MTVKKKRKEYLTTYVPCFVRGLSKCIIHTRYKQSEELSRVRFVRVCLTNLLETLKYSNIVKLSFVWKLETITESLSLSKWFSNAIAYWIPFQKNQTTSIIRGCHRYVIDSLAKVSDDYRFRSIFRIIENCSIENYTSRSVIDSIDSISFLLPNIIFLLKYTCMFAYLTKIQGHDGTIHAILVKWNNRFEDRWRFIEKFSLKCIKRSRDQHFSSCI